MKLKHGRLPGKPKCPQCGTILDAYSDVQQTGDAIRPGDYTFCVRCAAPLEWNGYYYNRLTGSALVLARLSPDFVETEAMVRHMRKLMKR
jgi:hypothetical protein